MEGLWLGEEMKGVMVRKEVKKVMVRGGDEGGYG